MNRGVMECLDTSIMLGKSMPSEFASVSQYSGSVGLRRCWRVVCQKAQISPQMCLQNVLGMKASPASFRQWW